jgi:predicted transcriptional regulator of viral defense system
MIRRPHFFLEYHLDTLRAQGIHTFTLPALRQQFDISNQALDKALQRLKQKKKAICLRKGFYVITPVPTPNLFIPDLMKFLNKSYYTGLLTAAAHHLLNPEPPTDYHIITTKPVLLPIRTDQININFYYKRQWQQEDIVDDISSSELTALDLVHYADRLGGLNKIIEELDFLTEIMDAKILAATAKNYANTTTVQRLGYILHEILYNVPFSESLIDHLKTTKYFPVLLHPQKEKPENMVSGNIWRVVPNIKINGNHIVS